jgi:alkylation response protein AidB-like acyl-CoA dehydrogenase
MDISAIENNVAALAAEWLPQRDERLRRTALDPADFEALGDAGFTLTAVPAGMGGAWRGLAASGRAIAGMCRTLARVDPSLALVATMHPTVLTAWSVEPDTPPADAAAYDEQRARVLEAARAGSWFGTVSSEPGSGGDLWATRTAAVPDPAGAGDRGGWRLTGDKHMGSGSGVMDFMITYALPAGESEPDIFLIDARDRSWDGSNGMTLVREWDGHGMAATQSHAFHFEALPAERHALACGFSKLPRFMPASSYTFASVTMGVLDAACAEAHKRLAPRRDRLGAHERMSWARAANGIWLADQAFEGMAAAIEAGTPVPAVQHGKLAIAELAETAMRDIGLAVGGSAFSRGNPFGQWAQDVRALGYLRPPWNLAWDGLVEATLEA